MSGQVSGPVGGPVGGSAGAPVDPIATPAATPAPPNLNIANVLTGVRVLLVPLVAVLLVTGGEDGAWWRVGAFVAFVAASITDKIDGDLARSRGLVTDFGKIADPIADKLLLGTVLVILSALGEVWWWITVVVLVREWGITLLRFWVIRYGVIAASPGGKLKTTLQVVALGAYLLPWQVWTSGSAWTAVHAVLLVLLLAATLLTVVTGADYVVRAVRLRREGRARRATA